VKVADFDFGLLDSLTVKLGHDPDDPVHRRMRRTDIEKHIARFEVRCIALRCEVRRLNRHS